MSYQVQVNAQAPAGGSSSPVRHDDDRKGLTRTAMAVQRASSSGLSEESHAPVAGGEWVVTEIEEPKSKHLSRAQSAQLPKVLVPLRSPPLLTPQKNHLKMKVKNVPILI